MDESLSAGVLTAPQAVRLAARRDEPDRYLAALLAPARQLDLLALAAFVAEIARIPATVSDPMIGEIRLQWWRDAIDAGARGDATGHPVADAIGAALRNCGLATAPFQRIIDARAFDLSGELFADDAALATHLAEAEGSVFSLAHEILTRRPLPDDLAALAGLAYGLSRALGRLPALLHNGGVPLSEALLAAHSVSRNMLAERPFSSPTVIGVNRAAKALHDRARAAMAQIRATLTTLERGADAKVRHDVAHIHDPMRRATVAALLPLAMVEPYFNAQNRKGFRRLEQIAEVVPLTRVWSLVKARLTARL